MNELMEKYASVLLESCLRVEKDQPLFISFNIERIDFVRIVAKKAYSIGVKDIYFDMVDPILKHSALENLEEEDLKKTTFWNKEAWNTYAKKNAAFLMLASETPGLMKDIDSKKVSAMTKYMLTTRAYFDSMRDKQKLAWTIAAVPTEKWAQEVFKNSKNPLEDLWNQIFEICNIKEKNPVGIWNKKVEILKRRADKLNEYKFKSLKYESSNGTNFYIELPKEHIWQSAKESINNKDITVNYPTEEVFTSPDCKSANGILYSSKPLVYQDVIIDEFYISFKDGKVEKFNAKTGNDTLKEMINICKNSDMLGEVALVPYDSPISNSNIVFLETLYDENAACHIALGDSFPECFKNGINMTKEELFEKNLNDCKSHIDFMIGTKDLKVTGTTHDNKEIPILIDGNFTEEFN